MRKLSAKWVPKCLDADQKRQRWHSSEQLLEFFWLDPNDFLSRLVTMDETWLCHYDPETKQHSMEWRHSDSHRPQNNSECKNLLEKFSPLFFGIKMASSSLIIFQRAKLSTRSIAHYSAAAIEGHFEGKTPREGHQGALVLARQCPGSPDTCNPEETGLPGLPVSWSPTLFSGSGPVGLPPFTWTEKTIEGSPFFLRRGGHCCRGDLVGRTTFWNFFEWPAKVRATG